MSLGPGLAGPGFKRPGQSGSLGLSARGRLGRLDSGGWGVGLGL